MAFTATPEHHIYDKDLLIEEPCEGKLSRTVRKWRRRE